MKANIFVQEITDLHQTAIPRWKTEGKVTLSPQQSDFLKIAEENHGFNYQLWLAEDEARRDDLGFEHVYHAKRSIDHFNQQRNDRMEMLDRALVALLNPCDGTECPVHSETPGMIIDRLSILALKQYHMQLQTTRMDASSQHREHCQKKLAIITAQLTQLTQCLEHLIQEVQTKTRTFHLYYQYKMYNDPSYS